MSQVPDPHNPYRATSPTPDVFPPRYPAETDSTGGLIPYKNPQALIAYYLGLFSLFPVLGLLLAIPAFVLGVIGLRKRNRNPAIRGSIHAWIGIILGGLMTLVWSSVILLIVTIRLFKA